MRRIGPTFLYIALVTGVCITRVLFWLLPRKAIFAASRWIADLGFRRFESFRERSARNLAVALGDGVAAGRTDFLVRVCLRTFIRTFAETGLSVDDGLDRLKNDIPAEGLEHLHAALAKRNGAIVLSAHLGNFMLVGSRLAAEGLAVYTLINHPRGGMIGDFADRYRAKIGQRTIHSHPRREAFRELTQVLKENRVAVVIADEFRSGSGVRAPFFGRDVIARRGPATLALRTGAAVVPACLLRQADGGLKLVVEPELELYRSGDVKADVAENTIRLTRWLEKTVAAHPDQWNWSTVQWQEPGAFTSNQSGRAASG
jgi:Kdo2-lipid IVA lauroyltransferase/acyltransferase